MKKIAFERSIREAFCLLVEVELSSWDRQISLRSLDPHSEFRRVAYSPEVTYQDVFKTGLRYRSYNFVLSDYSYFQFWHDHKYDAHALRYAYYPNPFDITLAQNVVEKRGDGLHLSPTESDDIYQQALEDSPLIIGRPPVRYDLDLDNYIESKHPSAHLTVGAYGNNRWPIARVFTPKLFVLFICKHYYSEYWSLMDDKFMSTEGFMNSLDQALADEKRASPPLEEFRFTARERLHPYVE